jgi:ankyrin repeat protein
MLTKTQFDEIFTALSEKYSVYLNSEEGRKAFEAFKSDIQQINYPSERFHGMEMADMLSARSFDVVKEFSEVLRKKNDASQYFNPNKFQGDLNGFKVTLQNLLVQSSRAIFLTQVEKEASCLGIDKEAISKLITLAAHPSFFGEFKNIVTHLKKSFDKDPQLQTAIESALRAYNPQVSLGNPKRQENLRALINNTVQKKESLLYILQYLDIVSPQRFAEMKELSLNSFKKEVLLEDYKNLLESQGESPFDNEGHIFKFTQHFLDHLVPSATYAAAVTIQKTITLKEQEDIPKVIDIKKSHGKSNYELRHIDITSIDANDPKHWLCYHLGDAVNSCLRAGGDSERCIIDGLTQSTSGFYSVTEKKGSGNAKEKICAAIYAFISRKGNLILDSIEPLHARGKSEYADIVHDLVMEFAATVVQGTPIQRVCLGTGGNTALCFDQETLTHKALPSMHEQTQEGTLQYEDSRRVIVLAHSADEEERLQALIHALVGTQEESEIEDTQGLRTIVRELLLTYCSDLFYIKETDDLEQYIAHLKSKGLHQSFQRDDASLVQGLLTLESFYKEAFALMLPWVCQDKNIAVVDFFVKKGVGIDTTDSTKRTALCVACKNGQTAIIRLLLAKGADVNITDRRLERTPLHWAALKGHIEIVTALLTAGTKINLADNEGSTPLHWAARNGHIKIVTALLAAGTDTNLADRYGCTALNLAAKRINVEIIKVLLEAGADVNSADLMGYTPLNLAAQRSNVEIVKVLLEAGADVNIIGRYGEKSLFLAARIGNVEIVNIFLLAGADVDINLVNDKGYTPLHLAATSGNAEVVQALIAVSAINVNIADRDGKTPLLLAAERGDAEMARLLLEASADVNLADRDGKTPLLLAAERGDVEMVTLLLEAGPDVNLADGDGHTPLFLATKRGDVEIVNILLAAGAELNIINKYGYTPILWTTRRDRDFTAITKHTL